MSDEKKKSRITTACDYCRSKRAKCDGLSPVCTNCFRNSIECTYFKKSKKRGLPTGYISNLEMQVSAFQALLGYFVAPKSEGGCGWSDEIQNILHSPQNIKHSAEQSMETWQNSPAQEAFSQLVSLLKRDSEGLKSNARLTPVNHSFVPMARMDDSTSSHYARSPLGSTNLYVSKSEDRASVTLASPSTFEEFALVDIDYESLLTNDIFHFTPEELDVQGTSPPVALQYHGFSQQMSGFSSATIQKYNSFLGPGEKNPFRVGTIFSISSSLMAKEASQTGQIKVPLEIYRFPLQLRKRVENYFQIYHSWLPMLDRVQVIRHVARLQENRSPIPDLQLCSAIALIWSILALNAVEEEPALASTYAHTAVLALECEPITTIESIQSMLLLGLYFYKAGDWDNAWVLISSSSRMAIDVRLMRPSTKNHEKSQGVASKNLDNSSRERTWATVYLVNTLLAARMGRSPLVRATDWPTPMISIDGWEEWDSWKSYGASEPLEIESGRCLSIFNELLKVVAILNIALTCNMDGEGILRDAGDEVFGKRSVLHFFQQEISTWNSELPSFCQPHNNRSPMVAYLYMCQNMVWCTICVRLVSMRSDTNPEVVLDLRNSEYTKACVSNRNILESSSFSMMMLYPFMDYFILMTLNFPEMLQLNPLASANHTSKMAQVLELASKSSIPCRVTWDLYRIENGMSIIDNEYREVIESFGKCTELKQAQAPNTTQPPKEPQALNSATNDVQRIQYLNNASFSSLPRFDYNSRQRFSPYNQNAPKEELDLFMLDTDFAKSDTRLDKFMKNLGFVSGSTENIGNMGDSIPTQPLMSPSHSMMPFDTPSTGAPAKDFTSPEFRTLDK